MNEKSCEDITKYTQHFSYFIDLDITWIIERIYMFYALNSDFFFHLERKKGKKGDLAH